MLQNDLGRTNVVLRETQTRLAQATDQHLRLKYDYESLAEELSKAKLKVAELSELMNAK